MTPVSKREADSKTIKTLTLLVIKCKKRIKKAKAKLILLRIFKTFRYNIILIFPKSQGSEKNSENLI